MRVIIDEKLRENAQLMGDLIREGIKAEFIENKSIVAVRNAGLMIGIELDRPCGELVKMALDAKLLINVTADKVIRLLPPLIINKAESLELVARLSVLIKQFLSIENHQK